MADKRQMIMILFLALCQGALGGCYKRYGCYSWWSTWYFWCILFGILLCGCGLVGACYRKRRMGHVHSGPVVVIGAGVVPDHVYNNSGYITSPNDPGVYVFGGPPSYSQVQMGHVSPPGYHEVVKYPTQPESSAAGFPGNSHSMPPTAPISMGPGETMPPYPTHPTSGLPTPPSYPANTNTS